MVGDGLAKWVHNKVLCKVIAEGEWALADNAEAREPCKLAVLKKAFWHKGQKTVQQ